MVIRGEGFLKIVLTLLFGAVSLCSNAQQERVLPCMDLFSGTQVAIVDKMEKNFHILTGDKGKYGMPTLPFSLSFGSVQLPLRTSGFVHIAPDMSMEQWGIICLGEWKFEQRTGIPLRIRLGSLQYVDMLEGKSGGNDYLPR